MEYLQYKRIYKRTLVDFFSFKPYYKWNTFNTYNINGQDRRPLRFKPYYKWNTFNTAKRKIEDFFETEF